jgi:hypothetical protein
VVLCAANAGVAILATVIAAAKISFATFAMISFSAMFIDTQKN